MKQTRKIEVVPYNPLWVEQFKCEAAEIKKALGETCIVIHHVGSTSVPGLAAKPKIDVITVVNTDPTEAIKKLEAIGFDYRGEFNIPLHYGFSKRGEVEVNLHLYQDGHPEIELNLTFRDYLRTHPDLRDEYAALKFSLLQNKASFEKNNSMFTGYNLGKDAFIRKVLALAGFNRLRFVRCTHYAEWEFAKQLCQSDLNEHPDHVHFILSRGMEMIGYAHIQPNAKVTIILVEENEFDRKQFSIWIDTWLKARNSSCKSCKIR